jgi:hypothetical protein
MSKPRSKALTAYSNYLTSNEGRNLKREAKGKEPVTPCTQQEFLLCCFDEAYERNPCAAEGCDKQSTSIDPVDTSILSYSGNCQPLCQECDASKGG